MPSSLRAVLFGVMLIFLLSYNPISMGRTIAEEELVQEIISSFQWDSSDYYITKLNISRQPDGKTINVNKRIYFDESERFFLSRGFILNAEDSDGTQQVFNKLNGWELYSYQIYVRHDKIAIRNVGSYYEGILSHFVLLIFFLWILKEMYDINKVDEDQSLKPH